MEASNTEYRHGDRVIVTCHQVHTTYGGLVNDSHEHHGRVQSTSIYGNVWIDLDDSTGPASKWTPAAIRHEETQP